MTHSKSSPKLFSPIITKITLIAVIAVASGPSFGQSLPTLAPGQWYEIPDSALNFVVPEVLPEGVRGSTGTKAVIHAWSGGAFDNNSNRLLVWGGGHGNYAGNEVYAFDLGTLAWSRLSDPSSLDRWTKGDPTMPDGTPLSQHSYDHLVYLPPPYDQLWVQGGSRWIDGFANVLTWGFDLKDGTWRRLQDVPGKFTSGLSNTTAYDPLTGHIFQHGTRYIMEYDPSANMWSTRSGELSNLPLAMTGAIDPKRRIFMMVGNGEILYVDIRPDGQLTRESMSTTGGGPVVNCKAPGLAYDSASEFFVGWCGGGDVYSLDFDKKIWTKHASTSAANPVDPYSTYATPPYNGTYGRYQYVPEKNIFVLYYWITENVWIYRLSDAEPPVRPNPPDPLDTE